MRHLAGSFNVIGRLVRQHTAKHCDIHRHAVMAQQRRFFFRGRTFFFRQTVRQRFHGVKLCGADVRQLFRFRTLQRIVLIRFSFNFAKAFANSFDVIHRFPGFNPALHQNFRGFAGDAAAADANMAGQCLLKKFGGTPCAFQALRRDTQTGRPTKHHRFRRAGIVAVEVSGRISRC